MFFKRLYSRKIQICRDDEVNQERTTTILPAEGITDCKDEIEETTEEENK